MIELRDVGVKRSDWVLRHIDLQIQAGAMLGIIGNSGAGKTTLLKAMGGFLDLEEGAVLFKGKKLLGPSVKLVVGYDDIQMVNQDFKLEPYHTVEENIREKILSRHREDQTFLVNHFLDLVELNEIKDRKAIDLSGGEQQRLALAGALACEPEVVLLDEPFVHLDQRLRWKIVRYLTQLNREMKTTIVIVSHDGSELMGFVDEICHIGEGKVIRHASASEMYYQPEDRGQAELMGHINEIVINGETKLFRPGNFYSVKSGGIKVDFVNAVDVGSMYYNYFRTENNEEVMLYSQQPLENTRQIKVENHEVETAI